ERQCLRLQGVHALRSGTGFPGRGRIHQGPQARRPAGDGPQGAARTPGKTRTGEKGDVPPHVPLTGLFLLSLWTERRYALAEEDLGRYLTGIAGFILIVAAIVAPA